MQETESRRDEESRRARSPAARPQREYRAPRLDLVPGSMKAPDASRSYNLRNAPLGRNRLISPRTRRAIATAFRASERSIGS